MGRSLNPFLESLACSFAYPGWFSTNTPGIAGNESAPLITTRSRVRLDDIDSEVMIDFAKAFQENPEWYPSLSLKATRKQESRETHENLALFLSFERGTVLDEEIDKDGYWDDQATDRLYDEDQVLRREFQQKPLEKSEMEQLEADLILLPTRAYGFVLRTRTWGM